jgi:putative tryptophan/tyrosine transport system permease protein
MELWIGAINLGFLYAFVAIGIYFTFRLLNFPDITVDGSFTTGASIAAVLIISGVNPFFALVLAFLAGAIAGALTGIIHATLNINSLLAGILVMTGLYSVNLHIMGRSNIPLLNNPGFMTFFDSFNPGINTELWLSMCLAIVMAFFWTIISLFLKTDFGLTLRMTGDNPIMTAATGVNVTTMKIVGVSVANGFVALSGGLVAQYQGFADIGMGIGTVVIGLASVIIGESLFKKNSVYLKILSAIIGSLIFRFLIAFALYAGMDPIDLKLLTAFFVLITLLLSKAFSSSESKLAKSTARIVEILNKRRTLLITIVLIIISVSILYTFFIRVLAPARVKIGVVQLADNGLLNITRDALVKELRLIGYKDGENCTIDLQNANGEMPTLNTILDKFLVDDVDIVVPISTGATQAALNKIKDRPVVFATVANPFLIKAGISNSTHLANVTGVYGGVPMDTMLLYVRQILPGKRRIGCIWDPSQANAVFNVEQLKKAIAQFPEISFEGATINGTSEVFQAASSLAEKDIDAYVLAPDNIVYSAFESIVKVARHKKIPIFVNDVERLSSGALLSYGYDYTTSGEQAAHLADRILKGENPANIPFEHYTKITLGINLDVEREYGIKVPASIVDKATIRYEASKEISQKVDDSSQKQIRVALFHFNDQKTILEAKQGVHDELKQSGAIKKFNLLIDDKSAQNEFSIAQSIVQEIVQKKYDYVISLSTPALQFLANGNKVIPHIFGAVTDPYRMGVAKSSQDHIPNITGVATFQPVARTLALIREVFPSAKRIGIVWNPSEACSEACTMLAREKAKEYGFTLLERTVTSTSEVRDAVNSLINEKIDIFYTAGDNTVNLAILSIVNMLEHNRIPYVTNNPSDIELGVFLGLGADYYEVGKEVAKKAEVVFAGKDPKDIPIQDYVPEKLAINETVAKKYGIPLSQRLLARAHIVKRQ